MERTVAGILRRHFPRFVATHGVPWHVHRAARLLSICRTAQLGGHLQACPHGHTQRVIYHSCRHRLCPQCNALPTERWLEKMRARLIACAHHHLIFTMPHELHGLWRYNRAAMMQMLFAAVAETLHALCGDERYLGAEPGFILALHTWGRSLSLHPHIHALVSDGGLDAQGQWRSPKRSCFLPARVVMALFRGKLLAKLAGAVDRERLQLPPEASAQRLRNLLNRLGRVKWNVHLCRRYAHGAGVITYLARYVRGGPLKNSQLLATDPDTVGFRYHAHADTAEGTDRNARTLTLRPAQFLARYLQHTPLPHKPIVRHYGLYAPRKAKALERARGGHQQPPLVEAAPLSAQAYYLRRAGGATAATHCAICGAALIVRAPLPRSQAPPCRARR